MNAPQQMMLPPFRLYGLVGCPHCMTAEAFLRSRQCPVITVISNDDPIATAGVTAVTGAAEFPVLCYTPNKEVLKGFIEGEYERLVADYRTRLSAGAFDIPTGAEQSGAETPAAPAEAATGAV